jgi:hypothetical protein
MSLIANSAAPPKVHMESIERILPPQESLDIETLPLILVRYFGPKFHYLEHAHQKDPKMAPNLDDLIEWLLDKIISSGEDGQSALFYLSSALQDLPCETKKCIRDSPIKM